MDTLLAKSAPLMKKGGRPESTHKARPNIALKASAPISTRRTAILHNADQFQTASNVEKRSEADCKIFRL